MYSIAKFTRSCPFVNSDGLRLQDQKPHIPEKEPISFCQNQTSYWLNIFIYVKVIWNCLYTIKEDNIDFVIIFNFRIISLWSRVFKYLILLKSLLIKYSMCGASLHFARLLHWLSDYWFWNQKWFCHQLKVRFSPFVDPKEWGMTTHTPNPPHPHCMLFQCYQLVGNVCCYQWTFSNCYTLVCLFFYISGWYKHWMSSNGLKTVLSKYLDDHWM